MKAFIITVVLILLAIIACIFEITYQATKKYYPDMSRIEYFILYDKIRITPHE